MTLHERRARAAALRADLWPRPSPQPTSGPWSDLAARVVAELGRLPNDSTTGSWSSAQALDILATPAGDRWPPWLRLQDAADGIPGGSW
jgi:hypothetical protein